MTDEGGADVSEVAEEPMESSAMSEEDTEEPKKEAEEEQPSPKKGKSLAVGEIIEGKRAKKTIERLNFQMPKPKEKLKIEDGGGDKLGDIPRTNYHIGRMKPADLKPLHTILFDRPGKMATMRKNMRLFNGFPFDSDSDAYAKKREKLLRTSSFTNFKLRGICKVLDLEKKGTQSDLIDRILTFLIAPKNSGKPLSKKKKKSKKKLSGGNSKSSTKKKSKPKPRSSSSSPKKAKAGSKSKAIVMDSSSDDDEDDDKAGGGGEAEGSDGEEKPSKKDEELSDESEEESAEEEEDDDEEEDEDEDESPKSKSGKGKAAPKKSVKRPRTPSKKTAPPKKRAKKEVSEASESDADSEADEKPRKKAAAKRAAQAKPAAKTKKADSSSNSKKTASAVTGDSTDDDEPLIKIIKKAPTDEQLKETVQSLLKEANLEEMTMKQICQRVYDTYPDHDLTSRKDYIKHTVKSLIT